jgi:hypothetical protein
MPHSTFETRFEIFFVIRAVILRDQDDILNNILIAYVLNVGGALFCIREHAKMASGRVELHKVVVPYGYKRGK